MGPTKLISALAVSALTFWNCSNEQGNSNAPSIADDKSAVLLKMNYMNVPLVDSLVLNATGNDTTIHLVSTPDKPHFQLDLFSGDWNFKAELHANKMLMQKGEVAQPLEAGKSYDLEIPMHALKGFFYLEIPLGVGNPMHIASGSMTLTEGANVYTFPLEFEGLNGVFKSSALDLQKTYEIAIVLRDEDGVEIYSMEDEILLDENAPVPELEIKSLRAKITMAIRLADERDWNLKVNLPSTKRKPFAGDLFITEFQATTTPNDSLQYEFVEIFNGGTDSLMLDDCFLGVSSTDKNLAKVKEKILLPGEIFVLADTSEKVLEAHRTVEKMPEYTGTKSSIVLTCGGLVMDSLFYSKPDATYPGTIAVTTSTAYPKKSTHLNINHILQKADSSSWCIDIPSPGVLSYCN